MRTLTVRTLTYFGGAFAGAHAQTSSLSSRGMLTCVEIDTVWRVCVCACAWRDACACSAK